MIDIGLVRSYMAGHYVVEPLDAVEDYDPVVCTLDSADESNIVLGDPVGLTRLFMRFIDNRDCPERLKLENAGLGMQWLLLCHNKWIRFLEFQAWLHFHQPTLQTDNG